MDNQEERLWPFGLSTFGNFYSRPGLFLHIFLDVEKKSLHIFMSEKTVGLSVKSAQEIWECTSREIRAQLGHDCDVNRDRHSCKALTQMKRGLVLLRIDPPLLDPLSRACL